MCEPRQAGVADASFLELVLECNQQESLGDSFSTLGLHSIFSEEDCQSSVVSNSQKNNKKDRIGNNNNNNNRKKKTKGATSTATTNGKSRLDHVVEDEHDNLNLRSLVREGSSASHAKSASPAAAGYLAAGGAVGYKMAHLCPGDRWLDSTSKSKSCRNFCDDAASAAGDGNDQQQKEQVAGSCRSIVSQALEITEFPRSSFATSRMGMSMSCLDLYSRTAEGSGDTPPSVPSRGNGTGRWAKGNISISGGDATAMAQSCRYPNDADSSGCGDATPSTNVVNGPPLSPGGATARVSNSRLRRALSSASGKTGTNNSKAPLEKRKTMLSVGKSLSARNVIDTSDRALPTRVTVRSKSVRHVSSRTSQVDSADGGTMPLSPIVRSSKRLSSREFKDTMAAPSLNGRKFVSYSRSLSRKDLDNVNVNDTTGALLNSAPSSSLEEARLPVATTAKEHRHVNASDVGRTISGSLAGFLEKTSRSQQQSSELPDVVVATTSRRKLQAKSKSFRHVPGGRKNMLSFGKSLSARNLTEVNAGSLHEFSPMNSRTKAPAVVSSFLSPADAPLQTESDVVSIPSVSTMTLSVSGRVATTTTSPGPLSIKLSSDKPLKRKTDMESLPSLAPMPTEPAGRLSTKLASAEPLKSEPDVESLPSLAPLTPVKSPAPTRPAWAPSTAAVPEISTLPLAEENKEKVEAPETQASIDTSVDNANGDHQAEALPVYSTEEIRREVGSLHMKDLYVTSYREKGSKRSGRLAATRTSQSCRRLSSAKKELSHRELNSSSDHAKVRKPTRRGMKKDASRRKVSTGSELDANKHASSRNLSKGSREKPKLEKQRSGRSPRKSSRKQVSSRKLPATHSQDSSKSNRRSSHKRGKSARNINSNSPSQPSHPSQSAQYNRESRSQESRETSPNCVSSFTPTPEEKNASTEKMTAPTPPTALQRVERASIKRDCSVRSRSKSASRRRALNASFRTEERPMKEAEKPNRENSMREWNTSFRKRCKSFQGASSRPNDAAAPEIVW